MPPYIRNKNCHCVRCRAHGLMGAAILITLGVLFLMENFYIIPFDRSFPVLLLVIGCVLLIARTGSTEGHVQPGWIQNPMPPQSFTTGTVPPPSPQQPWTENPPTSDSSDSQVKP